MPKKIQRPAIITAVLLAVFLLFTILAKTVDVQPIGPMNTEVGFAAVNGAIFKTLGESKFFYILSTIGGLISLLTAGLFAGIGAYQWYKRHDLMKVDKNILAMGGIFLIVIILYVLFDKVPINYRPVLEDGALEASYPSTHTLLACVIMGCALIECREVVTRKQALQYIEWFCYAVIGITVLSRLLAGVHWFTDIIGGLILSAALLFLYYTAVVYFRPAKKKKKKKTAETANIN